jgi:membrane-anchored glycerophosphoryl diester phosphodiesterase (GDPDase)
MSGGYYFEKISQQVSYPLHAFEATSPRKVLFGINFVLVIIAITITTYSIYLAQLLYHPHFFTGELFALAGR